MTAIAVINTCVMTPPQSHLELWDAFIDELDRQGQAGHAADVTIPRALHPEAPAGARFGELSTQDVNTLVLIGNRLGRRGDIVKDIWRGTQQQRKATARAQRRRLPGQ
jgi:hypothetical protein